MTEQPPAPDPRPIPAIARILALAALIAAAIMAMAIGGISAVDFIYDGI